MLLARFILHRLIGNDRTDRSFSYETPKMITLLKNKPSNDFLKTLAELEIDDDLDLDLENESPAESQSISSTETQNEQTNERKRNIFNSHYSQFAS